MEFAENSAEISLTKKKKREIAKSFIRRIERIKNIFSRDGNSKMLGEKWNDVHQEERFGRQSVSPWVDTRATRNRKL